MAPKEVVAYICGGTSGHATAAFYTSVKLINLFSDPIAHSFLLSCGIKFLACMNPDDDWWICPMKAILYEFFVLSH